MYRKSRITNSILREVLNTSVYLLSVLVAAYLIVHFIGQRTEVIGSSMERTLSNGDNLIMDKISYRFRNPDRFDIVVFPYRYDNSKYIKRVIGLPGETVQITTEGDILINGEKLTEYYGREIIVDPGRAIEPVTLGEDEYFVLGDNRNNSRDSRWEDVGNIKKSDIIGRAFFRLYPFREMGSVE